MNRLALGLALVLAPGAAASAPATPARVALPDPAPLGTLAGTPSNATAPSAAATANSYHCSRFWAQHTEQIPEAYCRTSAPTTLCGYTPGQLRTAYGASAGGYTGQAASAPGQRGQRVLQRRRDPVLPGRRRRLEPDLRAGRDRGHRV